MQIFHRTLNSRFFSLLNEKKEFSRTHVSNISFCVNCFFLRPWNLQKWTGCILCMFLYVYMSKAFNRVMWRQPNLFVTLTEKGGLKKKARKVEERKNVAPFIQCVLFYTYKIIECVWYILLLLLLYFGWDDWRRKNAKLLFAFIYLTIYLWMYPSWVNKGRSTGKGNG